MGILLITILILAALSLAPFFIKRLLKDKIKVSIKLQNTIEWISLLSIVFFIITLVMSNYNIYWRGYKSTTYILLFTTLFVLINFFIINKSNNPIKHKLYSIIVFFLMLITIPVSAISFDDFKEKNYYENEKYRVEEIYNGPVYMPSRLPKIFIKNGVLEKRYNLYRKLEEEEYQIISSDEVKNVIINNNDTLFVYFILNENDTVVTYTDEIK